MTEFEVAGQTYRAGQLDCFQQLHVARRLSPILVGIGVSVGADGKPTVKNPFANLVPAADVLAGMSDDAVDAIVKPCLGVAMRKQGKAWAPVMKDGVVMFDIDAISMLQIVWGVGQANLGNFTRALQSLGLTKAPDEPAPIS